MNIWRIFTDTISDLRNETGISIQLAETRRGRLFPKIDLNTGKIVFNTKLRAFVALYNHMMLHPETGSEAVTLYTLYNMYTDTCRYDDANDALTRLEAKLTTLTADEDGSDKLTAQSVELQTVFILLHECIHLLFHNNRDLRTATLQNVRQRIEDINMAAISIPGHMKDYIAQFFPESLPDGLRRQLIYEFMDKMRNQGGSIFDFSTYLDPENDSMLEEFGCDQQACGLALARFISLNPKGDAVMEAAIEIFMALYILDYDRYFHAVFKGTCGEQMIEMPRIATARHANLRGFINGLFTEYGSREIAREFMRQAEARDEGAKRLMMPSVIDHIKDIIIMQHTSEGQPQRDRARQLEQRFAETETKILQILTSQDTWQSMST